MLKPHQKFILMGFCVCHLQSYEAALHEGEVALMTDDDVVT